MTNAIHQKGYRVLSVLATILFGVCGITAIFQLFNADFIELVRFTQTTALLPEVLKYLLLLVSSVFGIVTVLRPKRASYALLLMISVIVFTLMFCVFDFYESRWINITYRTPLWGRLIAATFGMVSMITAILSEISENKVTKSVLFFVSIASIAFCVLNSLIILVVVALEFLEYLSKSGKAVELWANVMRPYLIYILQGLALLLSVIALGNPLAKKKEQGEPAKEQPEE